MVDYPSNARAEIAEQFNRDPVLADFAVPFPDLLGNASDITGSFERIAESLSATRASRTIQFSIAYADDNRTWCVASAPDGCHVTEAVTEQPDLEILTDEDTWVQLVKGRISPIEAFGLGRMRVRGDITVARLLARRLTKIEGGGVDHLG